MTPRAPSKRLPTVFPEVRCPLRDGPCVAACPLALWRDTGTVSLDEPLGLGELVPYFGASSFANTTPTCGFAVIAHSLDVLVKRGFGAR